VTVESSKHVEQAVRAGDTPADVPLPNRRPDTAWLRPVERVVKPWGHEEIFALVPERFCGKTLHVRAGHALSLQYHERKEEVIAVHRGVVTIEVGLDPSSLDSHEMGPGDSVHVPPGVLHRVTARTDAILLEASTTELHDVVRLEDRYGREGTSKP
jgi:mannose-6-phosphate isomerase